MPCRDADPAHALRPPTHMTLPESRSVLTRRMVRPTARSMSGRRPKGIGQSRPNKRKATATSATETGGGTSSGTAGTPESTGSPSTSSSPDTCTVPKKRGRPADTPVQQFEKKAKNAQRIYEAAERIFDQKVSEIHESGALWDAPSVVARLTQRMSAHAMQVGHRLVEWQKSEAVLQEARQEAAVRAAIERVQRDMRAVHSDHIAAINQLWKDALAAELAKHADTRRELIDALQQSAREARKREEAASQYARAVEMDWLWSTGVL